MQIALVRHARSAHVHAGWIDAAGFRAWRDAYEAAGIVDGAAPPSELALLAGAANVIVTSDAPRAVASAALLAGSRPVESSSLLRELDLEAPDLGPLALPLRAWAVAVGLRILVLWLRRSPPSAAEAERIETAALWLQDLARRHGSVLAVTHHSLRGDLFKRLRRDGWRAGPGRRTSRPWGAWTLRRDAPGEVPADSQPVSFQRLPRG